MPMVRPDPGRGKPAPDADRPHVAAERRPPPTAEDEAILGLVAEMLDLRRRGDHLAERIVRHKINKRGWLILPRERTWGGSP
jgi:hypothetical protein